MYLIYPEEITSRKMSGPPTVVQQLGPRTKTFGDPWSKQAEFRRFAER